MTDPGAQDVPSVRIPAPLPDGVSQATVSASGQRAAARSA